MLSLTKSQMKSALVTMIGTGITNVRFTPVVLFGDGTFHLNGGADSCYWGLMDGSYNVMTGFGGVHNMEIWLNSADSPITHYNLQREKLFVIATNFSGCFIGYTITWTNPE